MHKLMPGANATDAFEAIGWYRSTVHSVCSCQTPSAAMKLPWISLVLSGLFFLVSIGCFPYCSDLRLQQIVLLFADSTYWYTDCTKLSQHCSKA